jgi:hypothetical protein
MKIVLNFWQWMIIDDVNNCFFFWYKYLEILIVEQKKFKVLNYKLLLT